MPDNNDNNYNNNKQLTKNDNNNIYLTDTSAKNAVVTILWASYALDKAESSWSAILGTWCGAALQRALIVKKIFTQLHGWPNGW